jgi:cytochrome c oxidase assembly protein subunit 15
MNNYRRYLWVCLVLVLCMVALGGVTRLTGSGLSITEWKLVHGTLPPLNAGQWEKEFAAYQASPEYVKKNFHMELEDFKGIFWLEYLHRLLGRIIGLVFLSGAIYYAVRRNISPTFVRRNFLLVGLVAGQGLMGWLMVKSGLIDNPHVSHYRLCAHLLLATLIAAVIYRTILAVEQDLTAGECPPLAGGQLKTSKAKSETGGVTCPPRIACGALHLASATPPQGGSKKNHFCKIIFWLIIMQICYGAFVAGLKAGYIYNEFPLMAGSFLPPENWSIIPAWRNLLEHHATVQFIHRICAFVVFAGIIWQYLRLKTKDALLVAGVAIIQISLGIATLLSVVAIPLASAHQIMAIILVLAQLRVIYAQK